MFDVGRQLDLVGLECFTHSFIYSRVDTIDIWGWAFFNVPGAALCAVGCLAASLASYPLDASSSPPPQLVTTKNVSRYCWGQGNLKSLLI